jgi:23S rRNA pseudouridine955/2504/2580 synthase
MKLSLVTAEEDGIRLDRWFSRHFPQLGHAYLQKALRNKLIRVDGKRAEANQRLVVGQSIKHPEFTDDDSQSAAPKPSFSEAEQKKIRQMVLYEDSEILVLNKPAGLATQGGTGITYHLDGLLPALQGTAANPPKLVHRLDKDTSGVIVLAKTARVADKLMKLFATRQPDKTYWALVAGVPMPHQGIINAPLAKQLRGGQEKVVVDAEEGKKSITEYRLREHLGRQFSWLELKPLTGRTHQLRAHLEYIGHPIYGDGKYGSRDAFAEGLNLPHLLHLHARSIVLPKWKGAEGKDLKVTAPLPPHMRQSWDLLGMMERD